MGEPAWGPFDLETQERILTFCILLPSIFSFLAAALVMLAFVVRKKSRTRIQSLVFCLSVTDCALSFLHNGRLILGDFLYHTKWLCAIQGVLIQFFILSGVLWTGCMGCELFIGVVLGKKRILPLYFLYHIISWGVPLATCIFGLITQSFGPAAIWCWFTPPGYQIGFLYAEVWIVMFLTGVVCIGVWIKTKLVPVSTSNRVLIEARLWGYIIVYIVAWMPATLNRVVTALVGRVFILQIGQALASPSRGYLNAMVYSVSTGIIQEIIARICPKLAARSHLIEQPGSRFSSKKLKSLISQDNSSSPIGSISNEQFLERHDSNDSNGNNGNTTSCSQQFGGGHIDSNGTHPSLYSGVPPISPPIELHGTSSVHTEFETSSDNLTTIDPTKITFST